MHFNEINQIFKTLFLFSAQKINPNEVILVLTSEKKFIKNGKIF